MQRTCKEPLTNRHSKIGRTENYCSLSRLRITWREVGMVQLRSGKTPQKFENLSISVLISFW